MRLLLDTCALYWALNGPRAKLPPGVTDLIEEATEAIHVSVASIWEMAIKTNLGKLEFKGRFDDDFLLELYSRNFNLLDVTYPHAAAVRDLPALPHRDPFDRILIAQCRVEKLTAVTNDPNWKHPDYGIEVLWA